MKSFNGCNLASLPGMREIKLSPDGWLVVEHGDRQGAVVRELMGNAGLAAVATFRDLGGAERCTEAMSPAAPVGPR